MRIGLNLLYLLPGEVGGTETYALSLINALSKIDLENTYYVYLNKESSCIELPATENFFSIHCKVNASNRLIRFLWEQLILPIQVIFHKLDILHSLGYISPIFLSCVSVVTIHDLNYLAIPEAFTSFTRLVQQMFVTLTARHANQIIAVSEFTKNEIIKYLSISDTKITVTHEAPKPRILDESNNPFHQENIINKLSIYKPYVLTFSSLAPHKNIDRLIKAFSLANATQNNLWTLVIAGHLPPKGLLELEEIKNSKIVTTGYLPDNDVNCLFSHADLFAFPSLYEGFGIPVLEAMQFGVPVACSDRGSLSEVANGAAEFFDPTDIPKIEKVIGSLMRDTTKREELRSLGYERLKHFSWDFTAKDTLVVYKRIVSLS